MKVGNSSEVAAASVAVEKSGIAKQKQAQQSTAARPSAPAAEPEAGTQLELSSTATQLLQGPGQSETFDSAKVQRITQAISEGKFSVNAEAVADKLLGNAREVLGSRDGNPH
ncbi:MAG: flagellar biosynthesis anti-sigma factor FlgM [Paucibacter sp.]|nr:flagellar biosynthesis anti-sigma factor FlgM [Roseateles sp.]